MQEGDVLGVDEVVVMLTVLACVMSLSQPSGAGGEDTESDDRHKYNREFLH